MVAVKALIDGAGDIILQNYDIIYLDRLNSKSPTSQTPFYPFFPS
jgi:hypothetical protein